jgi:hypothetical protein
MVVVKNLLITEFNLVNELDNKKNKQMQKCLDILKTESEQFPIGYNDAIKLLPKRSKISVTFELGNSNVEFANAIRRCLIDEISIKSLDFDEFDDFKSDDLYILNDFIKKQLDLIPIMQDYDYGDMEFQLYKKNDTDEIIDVTSGDIKVVVNDNDKVSNKHNNATFSENIVLCKLRPGKFVRINNIKVTEGVAKDNAAKYNSISNIYYEIIDIDPIVETRLGQTGVSSMLTNPKHFKMGYSTHRNFDNPKLLIIQTCETLIDKLSDIITELKKIKNRDRQYISDLLTLETTGDVKKISIIGEYWTVINVICKYAYIEAIDIKFIAPAIIHPEKEVGLINIIHPEFSSVLQNSIKKIIKDLEVVMVAFK